jgi:glucosamine-6-phosphate deaminase
MPFGKDLLDVLPFRDADVCDYVRGITRAEFTRREPHHHPDFAIEIIDQVEDLYEALVDDIHRRIVAAAAEGRAFVAIFPVGPTGQYPLLAAKINEAQTDLSHVHIFFMDEYAYEDGSTIDKASPWSFERIAGERLFSQLDESLRPDARRIHFPGPDNISIYDEMLLEASDGRGAEIVYGGIGWSGHFAFWDPHLWAEFGGEEPHWRQAHSAHVRLHPLTILHNSLRAGGDWTSIPPCAYTIGPHLFLNAAYRSFWCDAYMGTGVSWQKFITRLATHGPVTPTVPASYLQTLPGKVTVLGPIAEDIAGPRVSWQ